MSELKTSPNEYETACLQRDGQSLVYLLRNYSNYVALIVRDDNGYSAVVLYDDMPIAHPIGSRNYKGSLSKVFRKCTDVAKLFDRKYDDRLRHDSYLASDYQKSLAKLKLQAAGF
jgi:hypothetical protein